MEVLRMNLSKVRIPEPTNRIYKQECCISFETPKSEGGLFVDMNTFLAFGKDYVGWNFEKTGNPVYLHIKQTKKAIPEDRPLKKPTLLAIGIDGGFDNQEPEYDETYNIVILPDYTTLPFPSVALPEKVRLAVDAILIAEGAERKEQLASWTADKKQTSEYALTLKQIDNAVIIPPSGWKCAKCDKTDNLWLNLTDGMILCGRKLWDGSGGNNHAIDHYNETHYPLAVKLGTITSDLEGADVFSYPEDESVTDPLLAEHLAFFGIDFSSLQKTEMTTAEKELDQNTNFDWNRIQESGQEVEPLYGPGYTGLVNLGNSCYLAATMQVIFSTHSFCSRYYKNQTLKMAFDNAPADPTVDLNMQLTKLANGLLSGKYSVPAVQNDDVDPSPSVKQEGIRPRMFKAVIEKMQARVFGPSVLPPTSITALSTFPTSLNLSLSSKRRILCRSKKLEDEVLAGLPKQFHDEEWQARQREKTKEIERLRREEDEEEERIVDEYREVGMLLKNYPQEDVFKAKKLVSSFIKSAEEIEEKIEEAAEKGELNELVLMVIWTRLDLARRDEEKDVIRSLDLLYRRVETEILKRQATPAMRLLNDLLMMHDGFDDDGWLKACKKRMIETFPREDPFSLLVPTGFDLDKHHGPLVRPAMEADDLLLRIDFIREVDTLLKEVRPAENGGSKLEALDPESVAKKLKEQEKRKAIRQVEALLDLAIKLTW